MLLAYVAGMVVTGLVPLSPGLTVPFGLAGWLCLAGLVVWGMVRRRRPGASEILSTFLRPLPLALLFAALVVAGTYLALGWRVPANCSVGPLNCFKGYDWTIQGDRYYHAPPEGVSEPISRDVYIAEVGTYLRSAAAFGMYSLCLAWGASGVVAAAAKPTG